MSKSGKPTVADQMADALREAWQDIHEWVSLARRQRKEIPDADHCPHAPTSTGVLASEGVLAHIAAALTAYRVQQSYQPAGVTDERCDNW